MSLFKRASLRTKLILPIIFFTGLIFVVSQVYSFSRAYEAQKAHVIERVIALASGVAFNLQGAILFHDAYAASQVMDAFSADDEIVRANLVTADGAEFSQYRASLTRLPNLSTSQQNELEEKSFIFGDAYIFLKVPVTIEGETIAHLNLTVGKGSFDDIYQDSVDNAILYLVLLTLSSTVLYMAVQRFIIKPVYALNRATQNVIERKDQQTKIPLEAEDEIGDLVSAFNIMLERISQRDTQVAFTLDKLEQEKFFANEVIEAVQHALLVVNERGIVEHFNASTTQVFKCTHQYLQGIRLLDLIKSEENSFLSSAIKLGREFDDKLLRVNDVFGKNQLIRVSCRKLTKQNLYLFAILDVTEAEQARNRQRLAASVFESSQDGLLVINCDGEISIANPAVTRLLGYEQELLIEKRPEDIFQWKQFGAMMADIQEAVSNFGHWQGEVWEHHKDGHSVPIFARVSRLLNIEKEGSYDWVFILSDLSNLKEMERLEYLAHHDSLTGLANRSHLNRELEKLIGRQANHFHPFALLYLDLDGFKQVNDNYGHDAGDEVLKQVADRLLSKTLAGDTVARLSGDEFVVIVHSSDVDTVTILAEEMVSVLSNPIVYRGREMKVGVSIGVFHVAHSGYSIDTIMKTADTAMYQAKTEGKGRFVVEISHAKANTGF